MAEFKDTEIRWVIKQMIGNICTKHKNWIEHIPNDILKIITACIGSKFGENVEDVLSDIDTELANEIYVALVNKNLHDQKEGATTAKKQE